MPYALIVERDTLRAGAYRDAVEAHHLEAVIVADGSSATAVLLDRGAPALLIAELSLGRTDGFSVLADVRRMSASEPTAILVFAFSAELRRAMWELRESLGISEVGDTNTAAGAIGEAVSRALSDVQTGDGQRGPERDRQTAPVTTNVPEHLRSEETWAALERLALTDPLTGLSNRRAGERALEREAARARRAGSPFSLAILDVDHFKRVNDRHGHTTGDDVLCEVSRILTSTFRASDLAIRWGGDEFLVLLPDVTLGGAMIFAERARLQVESLMFSGIGKLTLSAGIVEIEMEEDPRAAIRRADAQLYEAKELGRNRVKG